MKKAFGLALGLAAALAVAGCSETKMQDLLGSGKDATPDESQVRINRNLAMPPDLNLRPPSGETSEDGQLNQVASAQPPAQPAMDQPAADQAQPAPKPVQTASATPQAQGQSELRHHLEHRQRVQGRIGAIARLTQDWMSCSHSTL